MPEWGNQHCLYIAFATPQHLTHEKMKKTKHINQPTVDCSLKHIKRFGINILQGSSFHIRTWARRRHLAN